MWGGGASAIRKPVKALSGRAARTFTREAGRGAGLPRNTSHPGWKHGGVVRPKIATARGSGQERAGDPTTNSEVGERENGIELGGADHSASSFASQPAG